MVSRAKAYLVFARHYLLVYQELQMAYDQGGEASVRALTELDSELPLIVEAQLWASEHANDNKEAATLCSHFADTLSLIHTRLLVEQQILWVSQGVNAARLISDRRAEASHLGNLGVLYRDIGRLDEALKCHAEAGEIAQDLKYLDIEFGQWLGISNCHLRRHRYDLALYGYRRALNISRWLDDAGQQALCLTNIANVLMVKGDTDEAVEACEKALQLSRVSGDFSQEALHLTNLAGLLSQRASYRKAKQFLERALLLSLELKDVVRQMAIHQEYSKLYMAQGFCAEAGSHLASALKIACDRGDHISRGYIYAQMGELFSRLGQPIFALRCYDRSIAISDHVGNEGQQAIGLIELGALHNSLLQYRDAVRVLRFVESFLLGVVPDVLLPRLYMNLGAACLELDLITTADKYIKKAMCIIIRRELLAERVDCLLLMGKHALRWSNHTLATKYHHRGAYLAGSLGMSLKESLHLGYLGETYNAMGRYREAAAVLERARRLASDVGAVQDASKWAEVLGISYFEMRCYEKAIDAHRWGLRLARKARDHAFELRHLIGLIRACSVAEIQTKIRAYLSQCIRLATSIGSEILTPEILLSLGNTAGRIGAHRQAAVCFSLARDMSVNLDDRLLEQQVLIGLSVAYVKSGWRKKAFVTMKEALLVSRDLNDQGAEFILLDELGKACSESDALQALDYHRQALALIQGTDQDARRARIIGNIGVDHYHLGEYRKAILAFREAMCIARKICAPILEGISVFNMGDALYRLGEKKQGRIYARRGIAKVKDFDTEKASELKVQMRSWSL